MSQFLSLNNVTIRFGGILAVNDVSIELEKGCLVGLIGPNGAGKTTLFNSITGIHKPTSGSIQFLQHNINTMQTYEIANVGIARTFQNIRLFKGLTALENIMTAACSKRKTSLLAAIFYTQSALDETRKIKNDALNLLKLFDMSDYAYTRSSDLPYGMQRKLEIARAMALNPQLLLLDEPAAGLNPQESETLMKDIRRLRDEFGQSILLIEHDMKVVMGICERVIVLDSGCVIADGLPDDIRKNERVIKAYLGEAL